MTNNKYNGYTNYATWRVMLEIFDSREYDQAVTPEQLADEAREAITNYGELDNYLAVDYALTFINDVNWYELVETINERLEG